MTGPAPLNTVKSAVTTKQNTIVNLKFLKSVGTSSKERRVLCLFARRAPRHVDAEHMTRDRLTDVDRDAAEEDGQEGQPSEVFEEGTDKTAAFGAVAQDGEGDGPQTLEDDDDGEVDLETVDVVVAVEPADEK